MASDYSTAASAVESDGWMSFVQDPITGELRPKGEPTIMPPNPKQAYGDKKIPMTLAPITFIAGTNLGLLDGMFKYGESNYLAVPVEAMTYVNALERHMGLWSHGEDIDPESGLDHLFHAAACLAILIGAKYAGSLIDNRRYPDGFREFVQQWQHAVTEARERHADKNPKHFTLADARS
jgi:hypothetical protein